MNEEEQELGRERLYFSFDSHTLMDHCGSGCMERIRSTATPLYQRRYESNLI